MTTSLPEGKKCKNHLWTVDFYGHKIDCMRCGKLFEKPAPLPEGWKKEFKGYGLYRLADKNTEYAHYELDLKKIESLITFFLLQSYEQGERDALKEAITLLDKYQGEPMTGNVVLLELEVMLDALQEEKKEI